MSRSRKVDPEAAVNSATALFWKHGYCNLGTRQIEEETGITRFTLQTVYGGKMQLFLVALDAYLDTFEAAEILPGADANIEDLAAFFERRGNPDLMPEISCQGCFMLNSMIEFSSESPDINQRAARYYEFLRSAFRSALQNSAASCPKGSEFDTAQKTEVLLSAVLGLNAVIRAATNPDAGKIMAGSIAALVRSWDKSDPTCSERPT